MRTRVALKRTGSAAALALLALALFSTFGMGGVQTSTTHRDVDRPRLTRIARRVGPSAVVQPKGGDFDPPEVAIGERLFLETRFAQFFAAHTTSVNAPLAQGDPVLETLRTSLGPLAGPLAGKSMNCRNCHLVDDTADAPTRAYSDFSRKSLVPLREDGLVQTPRNSPTLVNAQLMPLVAAAIVLAARLAYEPTLATAERRVDVMGTTLDLVVRMKYRDEALAASEAALSEVRRVEALLTTWKPGGELWRVDDGAPGKPVVVSNELVQLLATDFAWVPRTQGAFDPTVLPLIRAWDLRGKGRIPTPAALAAARKATGVDHFRIDASNHSVTRLAPDAAIDEGAWGKGYALELAGHVLEKAGVAGAILDLGGQVLAVGSDANERPWRVPVADPRDRRKTVAELGLTNLSASTSGNSERGRVIGSRRIGHILDPHTGEPSPDFGSVTVVAPSALIADILSTAFFVLGPEKGLALSASLRKEGVENEALFLVERGAGLEAVSSPGMASIVLSADPRAVVGLTPQQP